MLREELLRRVRMIELTTRRMVNEVASGQYKSHFKGHGVQFSEHRLYVPGDDVRHIDWKVSARVRDPLVKKFEEERELVVFLVVDVSSSTDFGSDKRIKSEVAAEVAGMLAYAATHTGDKVGVLLFSDEVEKIIPPKKGKQHVLRIIREVLGFTPKSDRRRGTRLDVALDAAGRILKHAGIVFVISDFKAPSFGTSLRRLARKHDVVALHVEDPREQAIPMQGVIPFFNPETGEEVIVDTGSYLFKRWLEEESQNLQQNTLQTLKGGQVEYVRLSTAEDYAEAVVRFFKARKRLKNKTIR